MPDVLIVDDEVHIGLVIRHILEGKGYSCHQALSINEAKQLLKENEYKLVLCDISLPGESGIELVSHIKEDSSDTAAMMVSVIDDPEVAAKALDLGAFGYLTKPFESNELLIQVENALRRRELEAKIRLNHELLEQKVAERTTELTEMNHALKVLLNQREKDKTELEERIISNVNELIQPYIDQLKTELTEGKPKQLLNILELNLRNLTSPFSKSITNNINKLTSNEIKIAQLVKDGITNKEIAGLLSISVKTVEYYRYSIRTKLGLKNTRVNLKSYFRSISP